MTDELKFIHRATSKEIVAKLFAELQKEFPDGNFETRGLNIYGIDPKKFRDFLSGFCYHADPPTKERK